MKEITIGMEALAAMFIIAMGEFDGVSFVYHPKLPKPFCENVPIKLPSCTFKGDLLSLHVNENMEVELWFIDKNEEAFFFTWDECKKFNPMLAAVVFTHIYDMIENMEDC